MPSPATQQVTWISRTVLSTDDYGNDTYTETTKVTPAVYAPGGSSEITGDRDTVTTQPTLYGIDPTLPVKATDVFIVNGARFQVDGDPQVYPPSPFSGWQVGQVVALREVTG